MKQHVSHYLITGKGYQSPLLSTLGSVCKLLSVDDFVKSSGNLVTKENKIYISSGEVMPLIIGKMSSNNPNKIAVEQFKNKYLFRSLIKSLYPNFYFSECNLPDLCKIHLPFNQTKKFIIKPEQGFFSVGVRVIDATSDLKKISQEIKQEIQSNLSVFPEISEKKLIIEEYIGSEERNLYPDANFDNQEIAVDYYYNQQGKSIILNIYHHPYSKNQRYYNLCYYTSYELFERFYDKLLSLFKQIEKIIKVNSLPIHAEFKIVNKEIIPIEFNGYRFGGFGLADLAYHAFGINPYLAYFKDQSPNWDHIWNTRKQQYYGWVCGYKGTKSSVSELNDDLFKKILGFEILSYKKIFSKTTPVFALAYIKKKSQSEILKMATIEMNDCLVAKKTY